MIEFPRWKMTLVIGAVLFFILAALPNALPSSWRERLPAWVPQQTVSLGLDLRGGSHLLLELDFETYLREHLVSLRDEVRKELRDKKVGYVNLRVEDGQVKATIRSETVEEDVDVQQLVSELDTDLTVSVEADELVASYSETGLRDKRAELLAQSIEIVTRRVNETGTKEPTIQRQGSNRILLQVPGLDDPQVLKSVLGKTAKMNFHLVDESASPEQIQRGLVSPGTKLVMSDDPQDRMPDGSPIRYAIYSSVALSGELLTNASASFDQGQPIVEFQFNTLGGKKFGEITQANIGKRFAVVLDNKVVTAPVIRSAILGGRGIIEGNFTVDSANELALLLRAGALPAPLKIVEERTVGPSLGADSVAAGEMAALIAVASVIVFMILFYGLFGVFASIALLINLAIIMAVLSMLQATLTLPGIAGIALTMGMAVDANVLIFERIREEIRNGKSPIAAVDQGFRFAFSTILDSNLTTIIATLLLFAFGSGAIKGFAVTLSIGIISSMFSAISITRLMIILWLRGTRPKTIPI